MAVMTVAMGASVAVLPTSAATAAPASAENTTSAAGLPSFVARDYKMTFHDEFDGTQLDTTKWGYQYGCFDPAQRSQAQYTDSPDNVSVRDGYLNLTARYSPTKTKWDGTQIPRTCKHGSVTYDAPFTSGMITTKTKDGKVLYAAPGTGFYAEARIKLPSARPSWSAFWGTGTKGAYPANGEIDVFESKGYDPTHLMSNVHTPRIGDPKKTTQHQGMMKGDTASSQSEFHTYGVRKTADAIEFYFDGQKTHTVKMSDIKGDNPFLDKDNNLVLMLNQMVGGSYLAKQSNWSDKTYVDATKYADDYKSADGAGATMYVDYVRVYEPKTEADKPAEPTPAPEQSKPQPTPSVTPTSTPAPKPSVTPTPSQTPAQPAKPKPEPSQSVQPVVPVTPAPAPTKPAPTQPAQPSQPTQKPTPSEQPTVTPQPTKSAQPVKPQPKKPSADRKVTTIVYSRYHWVTTIWQGFRKWVITVWLW
jgi:beta-glucanase (GH16 family)